MILRNNNRKAACGKQTNENCYKSEENNGCEAEKNRMADNCHTETRAFARGGATQI